MKILFVYQKLYAYVARDLDILREMHEVRECHFMGLRDTTPVRFLKDTYRVLQGVLWCDVSVAWFGKLHGFVTVLLSKVFRKRVIVVSGGDEVENCQIGGRPWGSCSHPIYRWFVRFTFRHADLILTHSEYNFRSTVDNAGADPAKTRLIYYGFNSDQTRPLPDVRREDLVLTIGGVNKENLERKGLALFVASARFLPQVQFILVGPYEEVEAVDWLKAQSPANVQIVGGLYDADMARMCNKAKVYVQASQCESFACSLAEAMLCECTPVVTNIAALPEVVGECGIYLDGNDPSILAARIAEAMEHPELGKQARRRIAERFPLEKRREKLLRIVEAIARK